MGATVSRTDFEWSYTQEPHATRRKEMLGKYPEMKKLMGHEPNTKYIVLAAVAFQLFMAFMVSDASWVTVIALAYCLGGTINHSMSLAIHEISHNLAFGHARPIANRILGFLANLPLGIPPLFYSIRPFFVRPKALQPLEIVNIILQISVDALIVYFWGTKSLVYMIAGTLLATGMHPMAGHFISEHYMFKEGYETYSYYGPLNYLTFNVGYHNEHHDFPSIPGSRLPMVIWDFVFDPAIGPYARVKRRPIPVNPSQSIDQPDDQDPASDSNGLQSNGNHVNGIHGCERYGAAFFTSRRDEPVAILVEYFESLSYLLLGIRLLHLPRHHLQKLVKVDSSVT
ncbi:DEGS1-like protein [Mya arenaria]|uniref:DEGS1-like protein n=1 Tax=Mya arenaria TaxID=6604 RepID=A0ABY7FCV8_MYAAR|nr:DEGS1-like protein [Mya arenaria]